MVQDVNTPARVGGVHAVRGLDLAAACSSGWLADRLAGLARLAARQAGRLAGWLPNSSCHQASTLAKRRPRSCQESALLVCVWLMATADSACASAIFPLADPDIARELTPSPELTP